MEKKEIYVVYCSVTGDNPISANIGIFEELDKAKEVAKEQFNKAYAYDLEYRYGNDTDMLEATYGDYDM